MSQQHQLSNENSNESHEPADRKSFDGLELVPTILKMKQMILLRHSEFVALLDQFNQTLETFTLDEPHLLRFTIQHHSDSTIFWKALIRITCSKVRRSSVNVFHALSCLSRFCVRIKVKPMKSFSTYISSSPFINP